METRSFRTHWTVVVTTTAYVNALIKACVDQASAHQVPYRATSRTRGEMATFHRTYRIQSVSQNAYGACDATSGTWSDRPKSKVGVA